MRQRHRGAGRGTAFFLDYFATGKLDNAHAEKVIAGIAAGCKQAGCALVGGETAEMPGMYAAGDYDLAGFTVGVVEKSKIIDGSAVKANDTLIGIASSGPHSNGYSLIRRILKHRKAKLEEAFGKTTLGEALMAPTRIYVKPLLKLLERSRCTPRRTSPAAVCRATCRACCRKECAR